MSLILRTSGELPADSGYDVWFSSTRMRLPLDPTRKLLELGRRLEQAFDAVRDTWWSLGRELGADPTAELGHAPTAAAYNTDFGVMMAWERLADEMAAAPGRTLMVCDDPWLFRHLAGRPGISAGRPPALFRIEAKLALRGLAARAYTAIRMARTALALRKRRLTVQGGSFLLVYGHPASTAAGKDAYFGELMAEIQDLRRMVHTDAPQERADALCSERTDSLHGWGSVLFALTVLPFSRWRPRSHRLKGRWGWLVRRAAAVEGGRAAAASTRWQAHCQQRWLASVRPAVVAWPWENHPWERLLCRAARKMGVRTLGSQHTVVGPHQFNFAPATNPDGLGSLPDVVICNGPAYRDQLAGWGIPAERLEVGGAFRIARFAAGRYDPDGPVFVALSSNRPVVEQLFEAVDRGAASGRDFLIKAHPLYPFDVAENDRVRRTDKTIPEQSGISAVLYGTGTSGIEGLLAGVPTMRLLPDDAISVNIMPEGLSAIPVTVDNFVAALEARPSPPEVRWDDIFSSVDYVVWRRLLGAVPPL